MQIEIADGWFSAWCNEYALDSEYSTRQHLFFVDLESDDEGRFASIVHAP